ncbi:P-loop NTPase fold protein [Streptomyces sp. NPDC004728]|uniref:P-loop NTPase fold protein n=1 Tax=Streptomyces sp. NPDC004728 TaxID=3154289 RepID=UPI0033ADA802
MPSGIWHLEPRRIRPWYERAVSASIEHPEIRAYLDLDRPQVTEEHLRQAFDQPRVISEVLRASPVYFDVRRRAARADDFRRQLTDVRERCRVTPFLSLVLLMALAYWMADAVIGVPWWVGGAVLIWPVGYCGVREFRESDNRSNFVAQMQTAAYGVLWAVCAVNTETRLAWWALVKLKRTMDPIMRREMTALLGPDHESLLVARSHDGLIDAGNPRYWISTPVELALQRKIDQMSGGAIAICGPRGVGKSTLLNKACQGLLGRWPELHFHTIVQTPANYRPEEFLLSLFQAVCRDYLALYGRRPRTPFLFRSRARAVHRPRRLYQSVRRWAQLLSGVGLVILAIQKEVRDLADSIYQSAHPTATGWAVNLRDWALAAWHGHPSITRLALIVVGALMVWRANPKSWLTGRPVRRLVHDCHNYLSLLQHIQSVSASTSLGASGRALTLGIGRTSGSSSRSFTYPELVWEFRSLLSRISAIERKDNWKVFIGIDELDRLGSSEQARAFLAEIKAIFDVPRVYFVLSVSEDIGAAFIRRGLPTRDVTDSSLEDVLVIEARTLEESRALLQMRVPGFTEPFVALVHALSGGLPRDLIRYTRKVTETHRRTRQPGLATLARDVLWEEAAQALSGFRALLAHHDESAASAQTVHDLHTLIALIRGADSTRANPELEQRILQLAHAVHPPHPEGTDSVGESAQRWEEFSCYLYFIGTLLEVFARRNFAARKAAYTGPAKASADLQRLAEARLEMTVSPHSARKILEQFRAHWALRPATLPRIVQQPGPGTDRRRDSVRGRF